MNIHVEKKRCEAEAPGCGEIQAAFAFSIALYHPKDWVEMRWGFNAGALLDEALDRLRFFIESQHVLEPISGLERVDYRTLSLHIFSRPGDILRMSLLGRLCANSAEQAEQKAIAYAREIKSSFPLDFVLSEITSRAGFLDALHWDLLSNPNAGIIQLHRGDVYFQPTHEANSLPGFWQSSTRSHEQIWRTLAEMPHPSVFIVTLRSSALYASERKYLEEIRDGLSKSNEKLSSSSAFQPNFDWLEAYFKRRLDPLKKFFRVQVTLASQSEPDESLARNIGTAITRESADLRLPGYKEIRPQSVDEQREWSNKLVNIDFPSSWPRLEDIADLDELFSAFRLPYIQTEKGQLFPLFFHPHEHNNNDTK
ncbi:MAG: hypothetical protein CVU44_04320 [Chloroflexi bacterium HGW-Chloroflexi-6]|nr:MAG: hypothetical protein CVU44_04320 [Chloroflexi bacterium HGW-Chloroflexi-6]